ncbi:acyl-CoA dehydrogenase family protein [Hydrogenophaga sp.]|uniref:acyl-CoA dehydrogenase family protein n=1 Tax=Hydrogenophaga sp. TaxID=1904254 RepID=UPI0027277DDE|nr:acyl-CoA dehydrogenase family protein [Hydrogenophaga sp.]MDO9437512.1 acyl-CoA dehydrogenase family protein [Hydrogenophaga sp.]
MIPRTLFSPDHEAFRDTVRRFIAEHVTPFHAEWEKEGQVPRSLWLKAGELGLLCCNVPEEFGGLGGDFLHSAILIEEMARAGATGPTFYLHSDIVAPYILDFGTEEQKRHWLPRMASGEVVVGLGMSEPSGGSDVQNIRTQAIADGDDYVINGQKVFITNGHSADLLVLACKTDPKQRAKGVSLILVETNRTGFTRGRKLEKMGCKAQDTSELFFADLRVPRTNLLGSEGGGFGILMTQLAQERLVQAIRGVSSAEAALEWTREYVADRKMFGQTLADFQNTRFTLADLHAQVLSQRVFVDRCIELHLRGELDAVDAAACKLVTTDLQFKVMDQCLQFFGGWGYMWEYPIARAFADARMCRIGGGTAEVMKQIIANSLLPKVRRDS